ncbi:hypothetical protein BJ508DRAFT_332999 [Ascobolus immersus RN42]|uniref:F-box domain-containing protein n=1 Tax=Ascobolus immersus RN42 TaxID=1160509 RepID=A0A3N4HPT2_ASCIM|nr:hypothetical protein BJ508DRAFT_332999 [Ascobolus immersus RN42]
MSTIFRPFREINSHVRASNPERNVNQRVRHSQSATDKYLQALWAAETSTHDKPLPRPSSFEKYLFLTEVAGPKLTKVEIHDGADPAVYRRITNPTRPILNLPNEILHQIAVFAPTLEAYINLGKVSRRFNRVVSSPTTQKLFAAEWIGSHLNGVTVKAKLAEVIFTFLCESGTELLRFEHELGYKEAYTQLVNPGEATADLKFRDPIIALVSSSSHGWNIKQSRYRRAVWEEDRLRKVFNQTNRFRMKLGGSYTYTHTIRLKNDDKNPHDKNLHALSSEPDSSDWLLKYYQLRSRQPELGGSWGLEDVYCVSCLLERWPGETYFLEKVKERVEGGRDTERGFEVEVTDIRGFECFGNGFLTRQDQPRAK